MFLITAVGVMAIVTIGCGNKSIMETQAATFKHIEVTAEPIELSEPQVVPVDESEIVQKAYTFDSDEAYLLAKIAMAEAEGEDTEGKALVILTILNRVQSKRNYFPDTIEEVIYQDGAFTPVRNGRFDKVEPSEDCYAALELVENGWDKSQNALYFERTTTRSTWHSRNLKKLFEHGNHTFYTEVTAE
jgi:N-acetylmuramoyl-L-alanine amidase